MRKKNKFCYKVKNIKTALFFGFRTKFSFDHFPDLPEDLTPEWDTGSPYSTILPKLARGCPFHLHLCARTSRQAAIKQQPGEGWKAGKRPKSQPCTSTNTVPVVTTNPSSGSHSLTVSDKSGFLLLRQPHLSS